MVVFKLRSVWELAICFVASLQFKGKKKNRKKGTCKSRFATNIMGRKFSRNFIFLFLLL